MAMTWTKGWLGEAGRVVECARDLGDRRGERGGNGRIFGPQQHRACRYGARARLGQALEISSAGFLRILAFRPKRSSHSRRVAEDSVRGIEDHTSQLCSKLFLETLFRASSYGKLTMVRPKASRRIDSSKLQAFHSQWVRPERLVVAVSGPIRARRSILARELERSGARGRRQKVGRGIFRSRCRMKRCLRLRAG